MAKRRCLRRASPKRKCLKWARPKGAKRRKSYRAKHHYARVGKKRYRYRASLRPGSKADRTAKSWWNNLQGF
jgi:hypothetical protein